MGRNSRGADIYRSGNKSGCLLEKLHTRGKGQGTRWDLR